MTPAADPEPTTTGYVVLALLAVQPWTAYELKEQVERGPAWFWPRTGNKLYDIPKQLVALGLASAHPGSTGRRPRTVYQITTAGHDALRRWHGRPSRPPRLESEALVRTLFADQGDQTSITRTLTDLHRHVDELQSVGAERGDEYRLAGGPFPDRLHANVLVFEFLWRYTEMLREWTEWAIEEVATWDGAGPQPHRRADHLARYGEIADAIRSRPADTAR